MKPFILTCAIIALITSCKSQQFTVPLVLKDSVSITYKQGKEQPTPTGVIGAAHSSICVIDEGLPEIATGATSSELATTASPSSHPQGEGVKSKSVGHLFKSAGDLIPRNLRNSEASGRLIIRVDTVFVERWHTQTIPHTAPQTPATIPRFYKDCTIGFWILLLLTLARFAFRIIKAIYLRK
ncbi:MAG: hypothetical protein MJZ84_05860 [Paludibacteraceae bacterium]|nr:hypothetical protein [Paludibacteraceae bacterium]